MMAHPDPWSGHHLDDLNDLLKEEWQPVREIPMGGGPVGGSPDKGIGFINSALVLLEKDE